ncbi:hypothetical protein Tco_0121291 [Tanacetum coccineum]
MPVENMVVSMIYRYGLVGEDKRSLLITACARRDGNCSAPLEREGRMQPLVARALIEWRLRDLKELFGQLKELSDKGFIRPSRSLGDILRDSGLV